MLWLTIDTNLATFGVKCEQIGKSKVAPSDITKDMALVEASGLTILR